MTKRRQRKEEEKKQKLHEKFLERQKNLYREIEFMKNHKDVFPYIDEINDECITYITNISVCLSECNLIGLIFILPIAAIESIYELMGKTFDNKDGIFEYRHLYKELLSVKKQIESGTCDKNFLNGGKNDYS